MRCVTFSQRRKVLTQVDQWQVISTPALLFTTRQVCIISLGTCPTSLRYQRYNHRSCQYLKMSDVWQTVRKLTTVQGLISDSLLAWRMYVVWGRARWALILPVIAIVANASTYTKLLVGQSRHAEHFAWASPRDLSRLPELDGVQEYNGVCPTLGGNSIRHQLCMGLDHARYPYGDDRIYCGTRYVSPVTLSLQ